MTINTPLTYRHSRDVVVVAHARFHRPKHVLHRQAFLPPMNILNTGVGTNHTAIPCSAEYS
jgi:hypothetical protein